MGGCEERGGGEWRGEVWGMESGGCDRCSLGVGEGDGGWVGGWRGGVGQCGVGRGVGDVGVGRVATATVAAPGAAAGNQDPHNGNRDPRAGIKIHTNGNRDPAACPLDHDSRVVDLDARFVDLHSRFRYMYMVIHACITSMVTHTIVVFL